MCVLLERYRNRVVEHFPKGAANMREVEHFKSQIVVKRDREFSTGFEYRVERFVPKPTPETRRYAAWTMSGRR